MAETHKQEILQARELIQEAEAERNLSSSAKAGTTSVRSTRPFRWDELSGPTVGRPETPPADNSPLIAAYTPNSQPAPAPRRGTPAPSAPTPLPTGLGSRLTYAEIPKKLHIVHFGGPIQGDVKANVEKWAARNPKWEKNLWVDSSYLTSPEIDEMEAHAERHKYKLNFVNDTIYSDRNPPIPQLVAARERVMNQNNVALRGSDPKFTDPNWGLATDLVRIEILLKKGGVYVDTDMAPGEDFPDHLLAKRGFICNVKGDRDTTLCNDLIGVDQNNKVLRAYGKDAAQRYLTTIKAERVAPTLTPDDMTKRAQSIRKAELEKFGLTELDVAVQESDMFQLANKNKRKAATIYATGPTALAATLRTVDPELSTDGYNGFTNMTERGFRFPPQLVENNHESEASWNKEPENANMPSSNQLGVSVPGVASSSQTAVSSSPIANQAAKPVAASAPGTSEKVFGSIVVHSQGKGTSGAAWVEIISQSGDRTTLSTRGAKSEAPSSVAGKPEVKHRGAVYQDVDHNRQADSSRRLPLTERELQTLQGKLTEYTNKECYPSAAFVAEVLQATKREHLPHHNSAGVSDPAQLTKSIAALNQKDRENRRAAAKVERWRSLGREGRGVRVS